jgi:multiple sugar transport system permease protein
MAMAANILAYIWKWLPFWTLVFLSARMAIPKEIYEAAAIDGATGIQQTVHITFPLMANVYLVGTLLSALWTLGDFSTVHFVSSGAPARTTDVTATYGFHQAFNFGHPELGAAAMMSVLPLVIPVVILLIRRLHRTGVQL